MVLELRRNCHHVFVHIWWRRSDYPGSWRWRKTRRDRQRHCEETVAQLHRIRPSWRLWCNTESYKIFKRVTWFYVIFGCRNLCKPCICLQAEASNEQPTPEPSPFNSLHLSLPNGLLLQFLREKAEGHWFIHWESKRAVCFPHTK